MAATSDEQQPPPLVVAGEPFAVTTLLPWHNLYFWHAAQEVRAAALAAARDRQVAVLPSAALLRVAFVEFAHFHTTQASVGSVRFAVSCALLTQSSITSNICHVKYMSTILIDNVPTQVCGFDLAEYDAVCERAADSDTQVALWQHPHRMLCEPVALLTIPLASAVCDLAGWTGQGWLDPDEISDIESFSS